MTFFGVRRLAMTVLVAVSLSACSLLPRGAAYEREILTVNATEEPTFVVYQVDSAFLPLLDTWPTIEEDHLPWLPGTRGAPTRVIEAGDQLQAIIWDSNENSLISSEGQRTVPIQALSVAADGTVFLPYIGETRVAGLTLQLARQHLQNEIESIVPSAQVQLELAEGRSNSVDLIGGVAAPGTYPLPDRNFSVLNLLAQGGGLAGGLANPQIRLIRNGRVYGTPISRLLENPSLDTVVRGGDQIFVEPDGRYFLSLGAAGNQSQHPFTQADISALDAIAIIGGVESGRGNPGGILILREYPRSAVRVSDEGPDMERVVFTIDLTEADGLFSARNFQIEANDLVLVTESPVTGVQSIFSLVGSVFGIVNTTNTLLGNN